MIMRLGILPAILVLLSFVFDRSNADVPPDSPAGGLAVGMHEKQPVDVRMVEEDVAVRIFADSVVTVASFSMHNEGGDVDMEVGFSFNRPDDVIAFRAFVDGRPVDVRDERIEHDFMSKTIDVLWKSWRMSFRADERRVVRVEYRTRPVLDRTLYFAGEGRESLGRDALDTLQWATTVGTVDYQLEAGKQWKGVLDRCRICFELVGLSGDHAKNVWPQNGAATENLVIWEYANYEPAGSVGLQFHPNMPPEETPSFLRGVAERYSGDALLVNDVGIVLAANFSRQDLMREIYHSFLARWDGPIPQIMEYAPGGRCRFDQRPENRFCAVWKMASAIFDAYGAAGELEKGMEIAPAVSRISGAVVDSLETCELSERDAWVLMKAKELRRMSGALIASPR